jgi:hypothetical protein
LEFGVGNHTEGREMSDFEVPELSDVIKSKVFLSFNLESAGSIKVKDSGVKDIVDVNEETGDIAFIPSEL